MQGLAPVPTAGTVAPQTRAPRQEAGLSGPHVLTPGQRNAADAIQRALTARRVFVALTGDAGLGKTTILGTVATPPPGSLLRVIQVTKPAAVSEENAAQIEKVVLEPPGKTPDGERHSVLLVDDAHNASSALLRCLTRIARVNPLDPRSPQVILAGRPSLWDRLSLEEFAPLLERIAVRLVLEPMSSEDGRQVLAQLLDQPRRVPGQVLTDQAIEDLLRLAQGRPERIEALLNGALALADAEPRPPITADLVRSAAVAFGGPGQPARRKRGSRVRNAMAVAGAVAALAAGAAALTVRDWTREGMLAAARGLGDRAMAWRDAAAGATSPAPYDAPAPKRAAQLDMPDASPAIVPPGGPSTAAGSPPAPAPARLEPAPAYPAEAAPPPALPPAAADPPVVPSRAASSPLAASVPAPSVPAPNVPAPIVPTMPATTDAPAAGQVSTADAARQDRPSAGPSPVIPDAPAPAQPDGAHPAPLTAGTIAMLLQRGDALLKLGDISAARQLYDRAASAGSLPGVRGVARTYDPSVIGRGNRAADRAAAIVWYGKAAAMGDAEADARVQELKGEQH